MKWSACGIRQWPRSGASRRLSTITGELWSRSSCGDTWRLTSTHTHADIHLRVHCYNFNREHIDPCTRHAHTPAHIVSTTYAIACNTLSHGHTCVYARTHTHDTYTHIHIRIYTQHIYTHAYTHIHMHTRTTVPREEISSDRPLLYPQSGCRTPAQRGHRVRRRCAPWQEPGSRSAESCVGGRA